MQWHFHQKRQQELSCFLVKAAKCLKALTDKLQELFKNISADRSIHSLQCNTEFEFRAYA